jgi:hypothetical protein
VFALDLKSTYEGEHMSFGLLGLANFTQDVRELKKLNSPKINKPIKKWANELNRTFLKEEIEMAKKHMKNVHHL